MPNNLILRRVEVGDDWRPLSDVPLVATVDISTPPTNAGPVFFRAGVAEESFFIGGETHTWRNADLSTVEVRGQPGDIVTIIGGTWA